MMAFIALVAVLMAGGIGLWRRAERFRRLNLEHHMERDRIETDISTGKVKLAPSDVALYQAVYDWHGEMERKYDHAAAHPWLPVAPDMPIPK
ncbi:MAG TPA: hypothetical protein VGZ22_23235 [Isosphaeraceae bacterium]|jgi:hypothetical protein|nr:hypothetical protein [Isosphaeraceae bacterium]